MKRKVIHIDDDKCTGCGVCIPGCPEGAIQMIDGKARLVSDLFCDGLGACLGTCPEGAITIEEREAEPYDERRVMENIIKAGPNTIRAHLAHLKDHGQQDYLDTALEVLKEQALENPLEAGSGGSTPAGMHGGCPGTLARSFSAPVSGDDTGTRPSRLTHWPIQLHLLSPQAPHYQGSDVLLAADCTAFSLGDFHKDYLQGKTLAIACPKLDAGQEVYVEKIKALIDDAKINTLTVMIMQVPCCGGLLKLAREAAARAARKVPITCLVVSLEGGILSEDWI
jgi:NAD-dependent dihydropyrimidine dehydrogenase PreA subunit